MKYLLASLAVLAASSFASADEVPVGISVPLLKQVECMVRVVKSAPHTDQAKWGIKLPVKDWARPYVSWRYLGQSEPVEIRFDAHKQFENSRETVSFIAWFANGLEPTVKPPGWHREYWGADKIVDQWKATCAVKAGIGSF